MTGKFKPQVMLPGMLAVNTGMASVSDRLCSDIKAPCTHKLPIMHQSIPPAPSSPPGYCGTFAHLVSPGGGASANFALPGDRAFANPQAILELLTRTQFPIRI